MTQRSLKYLTIALFVVGLFLGGFCTLAYIGAPIHQLVYSTPEEVRAFDASCGADSSIATLLCRGSASLVPMLSIFVQMLSPFYLLIGLSLALLIALTVHAGCTVGRFERVMHMRPLFLIGCFGLAVWVIATTLSLTTTYNLRTPPAQRVAALGGGQILPPFRRLYEPTPEVYSGMPENAVKALRHNFDTLESQGCLVPLRNAQGQEVTTQKGARVTMLTLRCMQQRLFARAGTQVVLVLLFLFNLLVLGRIVLRVLLRIHGLHPLLDLCLSCGVGALGWVALLWGLSVVGILHAWLLWALFLGIPLLAFPISLSWCREAWQQRVEVRVSWTSMSLFLGWFLLIYLALNFLNVVRPFPIGWDDLGSYLNRPRLLASYGAFIPSMSQFQWEYLTSLGFLLFGYDSTVASTFAMQINWSAGLLAVLVAYTFGRLTFGRGAGLLTALLFYTLPMTGHFSFADMKIDNASFFVAVASILAACAALFGLGVITPTPRTRRSLLLIAGLLAGFSFGIKATGVLGIFLTLSLIAAAALGWRGCIAIAIANVGALAAFGPLSLQDIGTRLGVHLPVSQHLFIIAALGCAAIILGFAHWWNRTGWKSLLPTMGSFLLGAAIACSPWMLMNMWSNASLSIGAALKAADTTAPFVSYLQKEDVDAMHLPSTVPVRFLPPELRLNPDHPECKTSAKFEELDRYWGYGTGVWHYLSLPWRQVMNSDSYGYYVTLVPALLLFPLLLLLPYFWSKEARWLRFLMAGTFLFVVQWIFVANGIIWYGIGMFLGLCLALEMLVVRAPDRATKRLFAVFLALSLIIALINRLWQFDTQKNIFEYSLGKVSAEALREVTVPEYEEIRQSVVTRHDQLRTNPYTYRIGTFISYFIPRNRDILPLADHQMQFFNCLNQERDHALTLRRLLALGFNAIIFDTNTQTIEKDPTGPLHRKVESFAAFVNDPALSLAMPVYDPNNGIAYILLPVSEQHAASSPPTR